MNGLMFCWVVRRWTHVNIDIPLGVRNPSLFKFTIEQ